MTTEQKITEIKYYFGKRIAELRKPRNQTADTIKYYNDHADSLEKELPKLIEYVSDMTTDFGEPISDYVNEDGYVKYENDSFEFDVYVLGDEYIFAKDEIKNSMGEIKETIGSGKFVSKLVKR